MKLEIVRAADSVLYLPIWVAQQGMMFERLLDYNGFNDVDLDIPEIPAGGDKQCIQRLNINNHFAVGICDPVPLFDKHCNHENVRLVATLIGRPPFFLAGFNLPELKDSKALKRLTPTDLALLSGIDKLIIYKEEFWTGYNIGKSLAERANLPDEKIHEVKYGTEFDELIKEMEEDSSSKKKIAVITADFVNLARFANSTELNELKEVAGFSVPWCFAMDERYGRFVTTGVVCNTKLTDQSAGLALRAVISAIQHACILLKSSESFAADVVLTTANRAIKEDFSNSPLSSVKILGQTINLGLKDEISTAEAKWIVRMIWENEIYSADLPVDRKACIQAAEMYIPAARHIRAELGDSRIDERSAGKAALSTINMHFAGLGAIVTRSGRLLSLTISTSAVLLLVTTLVWAMFKFLDPKPTKGVAEFWVHIGATLAALSSLEIIFLLALLTWTERIRQLGRTLVARWIRLKKFALGRPLVSLICVMSGFLGVVLWVANKAGVLDWPWWVQEILRTASPVLVVLFSPVIILYFDDVDRIPLTENLQRDVKDFKTHIYDFLQRFRWKP